MKHYIFHIALILTVLIAGNTESYAGMPQTDNSTEVSTEQTAKSTNSTKDAAKSSQVPQSTKTSIPAEKGHIHIPSWDELAHIHHFHKNRLKKVKRHFKKSVFLTKLLLFICHAAVLYVSYLHLTH